MDAEIRKFRDRLKISGKAVIVFSLWSILRFFLLNYHNDPIFDDFLIKSGVFRSTDISAIQTFNNVSVLLFDLFCRLFVGFSAIRMGNEKKTGNLFILLSSVYLLFSLIGYISFLFGKITFQTPMNVISTFLIDLTTQIAFVIIIVTALQIRKREGSGENHAA